MKKLFCVILTILMTCAAVPISATAGGSGQAIPFQDIEEDKWYTDHVMYVYEKGYMIGTGVQTFSPGGNLTRAMVAQMIYRIAGNNYKTDRVFFNDVGPGEWYTNAANWTFAVGAFFDSDQTTFKPNERVTRAEFCKFICRVFNFRADLHPVRGLAELDTVSNKDLTYENQFAAEVGFITGLIAGKKTGDGIDLAPGDYLTRAEAATILHSLMNNLALPEKTMSIEKYGIQVSVSLTYNGWLYLDTPGDQIPVRSKLAVVLKPENESATEGAEIEVTGTLICQKGKSHIRRDFTTTRNGNGFSPVLSSELFSDAGNAIILINVTINGETFSFTEYAKVTHLA